MNATPYLNFNGNCAEAFRFYERCLGGTIVDLRTHAEMPGAEPPPPEVRDLVLHARMQVGDSVLMASDAPPGYYEKPTKGMYVALGVDGVEEAERIYAELAEGGEVTMPLQETFWAPRFGMLVDRFGIPWMVSA